MTWLPRIEGLMQRRILLNYHAPPELVQERLPEGFAARVVNGYALLGVCLIQFDELRPAGAAKALGMASENAAHRVSVVRKESPDSEGVFVLGRHSDSRFMACAGGRLFPGVHTKADFHWRAKGDRLELSIRDQEGEVLSLTARRGGKFDSVVFADHSQASAFFEMDREGYSPARSGEKLEGLRLTCERWQTEPLEVALAKVRMFEQWSADIRFDHALIMEDIPHSWDSLDTMSCG